jgi:hypothetical protein
MVESDGMSGDLVQLLNDATPYVLSAVSAYGAMVLTQAQEEAATATIGVGRRLTQRIFGVQRNGQGVPEVLADVIEDPQDADNLGALRKAIRKALAADAELAASVRAMVGQAQAAVVYVTASGEGSVATHANTGIITTGDHTSFSTR